MLFYYICIAKTREMKEPYLEPVVEVHALWTSGSILTASNEGYDVDSFDPAFGSPVMPIDGLFDGLL